MLYSRSKQCLLQSESSGLSVNPCPCAIYWWWGAASSEAILSAHGKKLGVTTKTANNPKLRSSLCKLNLFKTFICCNRLASRHRHMRSLSEKRRKLLGNEDVTNNTAASAIENGLESQQRGSQNNSNCTEEMSYRNHKNNAQKYLQAKNSLRMRPPFNEWTRKPSYLEAFPLPMEDESKTTSSMNSI